VLFGQFFVGVPIFFEAADFGELFFGDTFPTFLAVFILVNEEVVPSVRDVCGAVHSFFPALVFFEGPDEDGSEGLDLGLEVRELFSGWWSFTVHFFCLRVKKTDIKA
jgi:hypothetical protein